MIESLIKSEDAYFFAYLYKTAQDCDNNVNAEYFEFEEVRGNAFSASRILQNILNEDGSRAIRTNWNLKFLPRMNVLIGTEKYTVSAVETFRNDYNAASNYMFTNPRTEYLMQLVKRDNPKGVGIS